MIAKHSNEQSAEGEGVEVVANEPHEDPQHGVGQYTEKRKHGTTIPILQLNIQYMTSI